MILVPIIPSAATGLSQKQTGGNSNQSIPSRTERAQTTADNSYQTDALLFRWSQANTPGAVIIVIRDGRVLLDKGYGMANVATKEPDYSNTVFDIASVSKQFTAMAIMILVERGKLQLHRYALQVLPRISISTPNGLPLHSCSTIRPASWITSLVWGESKKLRGNVPRDAASVVRFVAPTEAVALPARSEMGIQ